MSNQTQQIADTIVHQLGGQRKLTGMIGACDFVVLEEGGVGFKFKGSRKLNYCNIILNPSDTYNVILQKWNWKDFLLKQEKSFHDVYCEGLVPLFEKETGLYLTLS